MAFTNRYAGSCGGCGQNVAAGAGVCKRVRGKFTAFHKSCELGNGAPTPARNLGGCVAGAHGACQFCGCPELNDGEDCPALKADRRVSSRVTVVRTSGGTFTQNARGRCEDAPCCGCCNI